MGKSGRSAMFTGEYRHSVDEKGRVAVPARFRAQLDEGAVLCRWVDACLAIFPRSEWESLATKVKALPIADASARDFQRFLFAGAFEIELDRQGRFVLPAQSREWARLAGEAVIVGSLDHAEIWAPERWAERSRDLESPDAMSARLAGLGI